MKTAADHWVLSGKAKAKDIQRLTQELISVVSVRDRSDRESEITRLLAQIAEKTKAFFDHFGPGQAPHALTEFHHALEVWRGNRGNGHNLINLIGAHNKLPELEGYSETTMSFHVFLEEFRNDAELEKALTDLVVRLRELLEVADIDLSAQIARELRRLLEELENRGKKTLTDLIAWIDLGMKGLADLLGKKGGFEHGSLVYECLKLALVSKIRIMAVYEKAESEYRLRLGFSFLNKAAQAVPDIRNEEDLKRYLPPPDQAANCSA